MENPSDAVAAIMHQALSEVLATALSTVAIKSSRRQLAF
jgi:hypothetical protein